MHATAMQNGKRFFDAYLPFIKEPVVADIGAQDVNGSLRQVCHQGVRYVGVDFVKGPGVDVILDDPYKLPFETASLDVVISSSCFEHSQMFWLLFLEVMRVLKPEGLFYLNAPSNGPFHRYPVDCWRFYPDSGHALVAWAERNGMKPAVLESFVADQEAERWNDFVCVFVKDAAHAARYPNRMIEAAGGYANGTMIGRGEAEGFLNPQGQTEDQRFFGWRIHKAVKRALRGRF